MQKQLISQHMSKNTIKVIKRRCRANYADEFTIRKYTCIYEYIYIYVCVNKQ